VFSAHNRGNANFDGLPSPSSAGLVRSTYPAIRRTKTRPPVARPHDRGDTDFRQALLEVSCGSSKNMQTQKCGHCGREIDSDSLFGDFCSECAAKIRSELTLFSQLMRTWMWMRARSAHFPFITLFLVALNAGVYYYLVANSGTGRDSTLQALLEMHGERVIQGEWWRLLTSTFLHLNFSHLISNLAFLCLLGWLAEREFGHSRVLLLWITSGIAGSIAELLLRPPRFISIGASGVIYGLSAALFCHYFFRRRDLPARQRCIRTALLSLLIGLGLYGDWHLFGRVNPGHLGGLLAGVLFASFVPVAAETSRQRIMAGAAGLALLLSATTILAIRRQKVWMELDEIDPTGFFSATAASIPKLQQIVKDRPDILRAHLLLAEAYQNGKRFDDAIVEYRYVLEKQPLSERAWYRMGWAFMDTGRYENAIDAFSQSLKIDSQNSTGQTHRDIQLEIRMDREALARAYEGANRFDDSIAEYRKILQTFPDNYIAKQELPRLEELARAHNSTSTTAH
jgi:membrane associated rhomboid family serine protease